MWALRWRMTPLQVLRSATFTGAEAIGMDHDLGTLEPGKLAICKSSMQSNGGYSQHYERLTRDEERTTL